jgi:hypothetical protein
MEKEFIPYEQALALKELGFNEPCILLYRGLDAQPVCQMGYGFKTEKNSDYNDETNYWLTVPTFSQAFRWFREKHKLYHTINMFGDWDKPQYSYLVSGRTMNNPAHMWHFEDKDSHEEAELACLIKLIEIVKNNETHRIKTKN